MTRPTSRELALFGSLLALGACALEIGGVGLPVTTSDAALPDGSAAADVIAPEEDGASPDLDTGTSPSVDASVDVLDASADGASDGSLVDAGPPGVVSASVHGGSGIDVVGSSDQQLTSNFFDDAVFNLVVNGPIDGIILVTTNGSGVVQSGYQWDTIVGYDVIPNIGTGQYYGYSTSILGVEAFGQLVNDSDGRVFLGPGRHALITYADTAYGGLYAGQHYAFFVHVVGGDWVAGNVFKW